MITSQPQDTVDVAAVLGAPTPRPRPGSATERLAWVDALRGAAILLVALYHGALWGMALGVAPDAWEAIGAALASLRMPVFFFVSGLLAASTVTLGWRELLHRRVAFWVYLYVVWAVLDLVVLRVVGNVRGAGAPPLGLDPLTLFTNVFVLPKTGLWYLWALALFVVGARTLAALSVPRGFVLVGAFVLSGAAVTLGPVQNGNFALLAMVTNVPFFLLGLYGRGALPRLATLGRAPVALGLTGLYVLAAVGIGFAYAGAPRLGVHLPLGLLGIAAGVGVAMRWSASYWARPLVTIGRRTLPVYVMHEVLMALAAAALLPFAGAGVMRALGPVMPLLFVAFAVAVALAVHSQIGDRPGVFALPRRWQWRPAAVPTAGSDEPELPREPPLPWAPRPRQRFRSSGDVSGVSGRVDAGQDSTDSPENLAARGGDRGRP